MGFTTAILVLEMACSAWLNSEGGHPRRSPVRRSAVAIAQPLLGSTAKLLAGNALRLEPDLVVLGLNSFPHEGYSGVRVGKGGVGEGSCCGYS